MYKRRYYRCKFIVRQIPSVTEISKKFCSSINCRFIVNSTKYRLSQWRNDAPGVPASPGGAVLGGRQIFIKMWDNFARLTALLAKVRVWFNNLTIYLDFSAIFSQIAPSKPLNQGRHWGATFCRREAPFRRGLLNEEGLR